MLITPSYYTSTEAGYLEPWPKDKKLDTAWLEYRILDRGRARSIKFGGLVIHALFIGDKHKPHSRWDCINGWTKKDEDYFPEVTH